MSLTDLYEKCDIDMSKIESRPMSAALLNYLRFCNTVTRLPRRAALSLLLLPGHISLELDKGVQNALHHLREQSDFCRVLGSYPVKSRPWRR